MYSSVTDQPEHHTDGHTCSISIVLQTLFSLDIIWPCFYLIDLQYLSSTNSEYVDVAAMALELQKTFRLV